MKHFAWVAVMAAALGGWTLAAGGFGADNDNDPADVFMRAKLVHSQKLLEGLANGDHVEVGKQAEMLRLLSLDASWQVLQTLEYRAHSMEFRQHAMAIRAAAEEKKLEEAAASFGKLTQSCVACHKYLRGIPKKP